MKRLVNTMNDPLVNILPRWSLNNYLGRMRDKYGDFNTALDRFDAYFLYKACLLRYMDYPSSVVSSIGLVTFFNSRAGITQKIKRL